MRPRPVRVLLSGVLGFVALVHSQFALAAPRSWTGSVLSNFEAPFNWTPLGSPLPSDNIMIGDLVPDAEAYLDTDLELASLALSATATLQRQSGYYVFPYTFTGASLDVAGTTSLSDSSKLRVNLKTNTLGLSGNSLYESDSLEVGGTATLGLGATLGVFGDANFTQFGGTVLNNNGTIDAGGATTIAATNGGLLDLDGNGGTGRIFVRKSPQSTPREGHLTIDGQLNGVFDGTLTIGEGETGADSTITFTSPWTAGSGSVIHFNTGTGFLPGTNTLVGFGRIGGAPFTSHGTINLAGTNRILANATLEEEAVVNTEIFGNIDFWNPTEFGDVTFNGPGSSIFRDSLTVRDGTALLESNSFFRDAPSLLVEGDGVLHHQGTFIFETMAPIEVEPGGILKVSGRTNIATGLSTIDGTLSLSGPTTLSGGFLGEGIINLQNDTSILNNSTIQVDQVNMGNLLNDVVQMDVLGSTINTRNLRVRDNANPLHSTTLRIVGPSTVRVNDPTTERGTLTVGVTNHGELTSNRSHVIVDGAGSTERPTIDVEGQILLGTSGIGEQGYGSLDVLNGALVTAGGDIQIGGRGYHLQNSINKSHGFVTVGGTGDLSGLSARLSTLGDIALGIDGLSGPASLTVNEGGQVVAKGLMMWPTTEVFHNGGSIDVEDFQMHDTAKYHLNGGNFFVQGGNGSLGSDFAFGSDALETPSFFVHAGADVTVPGSWTIGDEVETYGTTNVGGANSDGSRRSTLRNTSNGNLRVGNLGAGFLNIDAGGLVAFEGRTEIGYGASSGGYVDVRDVYDVDGNLYRSEMQVLGDAASVLVIGRDGYGELNIENGGLVETVSNAYLGMFAGGLGVVTVAGESHGLQAELNVAGRITVGNQGTGMLTIDSGGQVSAKEMFVRQGSEVHVNGGTLSLDLLDVNTNGGVVYLNGDFTYDVNDTNGDLDLVGGIVEPGDSPGIMTVNGNFTSLNTTLAIEIGGLLPGSEFDRVEVSGVAAIDGSLEVRLYDLGAESFVPQAGDSYDIFSATGGITGSFDTLLMPALPGNLVWDLDYSSHLVTLSVLSSEPGDFNGDGDIDGEDLKLWESDYTTGVSNGFEFLTWQRAVTQGRRSLAASIGAVPEPASLLLAACACVALLAQRR